MQDNIITLYLLYAGTTNNNNNYYTDERVVKKKTKIYSHQIKNRKTGPDDGGGLTVARCKCIEVGILLIRASDGGGGGCPLAAMICSKGHHGNQFRIDSCTSLRAPTRPCYHTRQEQE